MSNYQAQNQVRRGESERNFSRTNSRNTGPLDRLMQGLVTENVQAMYQFCKNYRCRAVEALILEGKPEGYLPSRGEHSLAAKLGVPIVIIRHTPMDEGLLKPVWTEVWFKGELKRPSTEVTWGKTAQYLLTLHSHHERRSSDVMCGTKRYEKSWLEKGRGRGKGVDLSVSNLLRVVPGVGHIDIDGSLFCQECDSFIMFIEASSDGLRGTSLEHKGKATSMTRKLATQCSAKTLLLQHHVNDNSHAKEVSLTTWGQDNMTGIYSKDNLSWGDARSALEKVYDNHQCIT